MINRNQTNTNEIATTETKYQTSGVNYKIGWGGAEPTGGPPSTGPPDVPVNIP